MRDAGAWGSIPALVVIDQMPGDLSWSFSCSGSYLGVYSVLCPMECPHCVITLCLMLGSIEQISDGYLLTFTMLKITDLHQPPPISVDIRIFSLDYTVLHNDGALEEALEIPP